MHGAVARSNFRFAGRDLKAGDELTVAELAKATPAAIDALISRGLLAREGIDPAPAATGGMSDEASQRLQASIDLLRGAVGKLQLTMENGGKVFSHQIEQLERNISEVREAASLAPFAAEPIQAAAPEAAPAQAARKPRAARKAKDA